MTGSLAMKPKRRRVWRRRPVRRPAHRMPNSPRSSRIKLPQGFKIEVWASGVLAARQMAWGDKGTLFVGSFGLGNVYAITEKDGKKEVKTILKGLNMPTGLAFKDGTLYVIAVDKLIKYETPRPISTSSAKAKWCMTICRLTPRMAGRYLAVDKEGWFYIPFGPPFNVGVPRPASRRSAASIRRPATPRSTRLVSATASAATSIRA